jgi:hypothetical protein
MKPPSNAATKASTAINATNSQFTVDKSIGISCSFDVGLGQCALNDSLGV